MAEVINTTRKQEGNKVSFTVGNQDGEHPVMTVPIGYKTIVICCSGTDGSAVCRARYKNRVDGTTDNYELGTIAAGEEIQIAAGEGAEVFISVASSTGSTDLDFNCFACVS